jgi:hypothetical protein
MRTMIVIALLTAWSCNDNLTIVGDQTPSPLAQCQPNRDGKIAFEELPIATTTIAFQQSPAAVERSVALRGQVNNSETRWDFATEYRDDLRVEVGPVALASQWYASQFPFATFALDAGAGIDALYSIDQRALWLWGTASQKDTVATRTLVRYESPVSVLPLPLAVGRTVDVTAAISGATLNGLPFVGSDRFQVQVTASGQLDIPYLRFSPALLVQTTLTRAASTGGASTVRQTASYLYECFGEVVHVESKLNERMLDFSQAALLRRYVLP